MARILSGWIRLDRKVLQSDIAQRSPETFQIWLTLLGLANFGESKQYVSGSALKVQPGQLITGIAELASISNISEAKIKSALKYLKMTGRITDESSNKGRVISIVKWHQYQTDHRQDDRPVADESPANDRRVTGESPTDDRRLAPSEQCNPDTPEPLNPENNVNAEQGSFFQEPPKAPRKERAKKPKSDKPEDSPEAVAFRTKMFDAYADAIRQRWGTEAQRNKTINSQMKALYMRLGEDALEVLAFYVKSNDSFYVKKMHPVGMALQDAEALHMQWQKGKHITGSMVREFEKSNATQEKLKHIEENGI